MGMKEFILSHTALNQRELARLIDWSPASFNQWLKETRPIPNDKANLLRNVLSEYGFKGA